mmetsp:Transcript_15603/g.26985  ORF Transcript_15603/g.26985 Transcript_15603/m.26985 type:complete len:349 (-) Transcript_15603:233-1279(-)
MMMSTLPSSSATWRAPQAVPTRGGFSLSRLRYNGTLPLVRCQPVNDTETSPSADSNAVGMPYIWIAAAAAAGTLETGYLTLMKLQGSSPVCPISGCEAVLSSSYSEIHGVPLAALGMAAYGFVAICSVLAARRAASERSAQHFHTAMLAGSTLLAGISAVLVYLLQTEFSGDTCVWCYGSATLSFTLLVLTILGLPPRQLAQAAGPGVGTLVTGLAVLYLGLANTQSSRADGLELAYESPPVTEESSKEAVSLSHRLHDAGAKMYGAFWCSHCFDQKQTFGKQAMADFPYVECFPEGWKQGVKVIEACDAAGVRAFPTWVINGNLVEGEQTFEALQEELSKPPQAQSQ